MRRVILGEVWHRRGRSLALLFGILVATAAFAVFTGTSDSERLVVRGTVARSFRGSYDILVRPRGTETQLERTQGLVRDNYLSGIFGGITMSQYRQVAHLPGVQVAAPIAMLGYVLQSAGFNIDLTRYLTRAPRQLFAVRVTRSTDRGRVHLTDQTGYVYVTRRAIGIDNGFDREQLSSGRQAHICPFSLNQVASPFGPGERNIAMCWSLQTGSNGYGWGLEYPGFGHGHFGALIDWSFPFLLAAIDPVAEAKLVGLKNAVVHGRYLRSGDVPTVGSFKGSGRLDVPVLVSTRPYIDDHDQITISKLGTAAAQAMLGAHSPRRVARVLADARPGRALQRRSVGVHQAYRNLLATISHQQVAVIQNYWSSGPTRYRQLGARELAPLPVRTPLSVWRSAYEGTGVVDAPIDSELAGYRPLRRHVGLFAGNTIQLPALKAVGQFDPARLPGFSPLSQLPQETYNPPVAAPADARTRALLHGQNLLPDANLTGYLQPPPLLLTDLNSLPAFSEPTVFPNGNSTDPISVIRVRVAGVHGPDSLSRERVRLVAQRIAQATGLRVDITIGSSPTPVRIDLPAAGQLPALAVSEGWVKKGVAVSILNALNKQSAILFLLILIVCALFVYNSASASVQARRAQLGVLASLGWNSRELFEIILGELAVIGLAAGLLGAAIALPISAAAGFHSSPLHALLAIPAAVILALLAGIAPATRASRMSPAAAVRPAVLHSGHAWHARGVIQLGLINLARVPGRSLLAALSLTFGVGALTLLLAVTVVFHNALTGTLLGSAISLQVRATDYAAVAVIVILAGAGVADVLYLNLRERAAEVATLQATGWRDSTLARLVGSEALWLGLLGSLTGAMLGVLGASTFAQTVPRGLILVAAASAAAGTMVAILAAIIPTMLIGRLPTVPLLAGE